MKRDAIFYQIFKRAPNLLFELIEQPLTGARNYSFESVEIKEPSFRIDGVFLPLESASPKIVFFAEVQFQKDESLYHRFFSESLLYLYRNQSLFEDWYGVVIFYSRDLEPKDKRTHRALLSSPQVQRVYLDELGNPDELPLGISLMQLTIASEQQMIERARQLIDRVQQENTGNLSREEIMEVITTIAVYKFAKLSREEVEAMLGVNLEETKIYQEAEAQGERKAKLRLIPKLLAKGFSVEEVAETLELAVEEVRQSTK